VKDPRSRSSHTDAADTKSGAAYAAHTCTISYATTHGYVISSRAVDAYITPTKTIFAIATLFWSIRVRRRFEHGSQIFHDTCDVATHFCHACFLGLELAAVSPCRTCCSCMERSTCCTSPSCVGCSTGVYDTESYTLIIGAELQHQPPRYGANTNACIRSIDTDEPSTACVRWRTSACNGWTACSFETGYTVMAAQETITG
jgi:hypothetical protein